MEAARALKRGLLYFALVFGAGFVLGPIRVLWLVPRVGERNAELLEAPVMLGAIVLAARLVVRRWPARYRAAHLLSGLGALALVLACELTVVLWLRGLTLHGYLASRDPVSGGVYVLELLVFALLPWWLAARGAPEVEPR